MPMIDYLDKINLRACLRSTKIFNAISLNSSYLNYLSAIFMNNSGEHGLFTSMPLICFLIAKYI